jgi:deoxyribodipyrimidine photo-lyase
MIQSEIFQATTEYNIFWFRRDLRLQDNVSLIKALNGPYPVLPVFIFDPDILNKLNDKSDRRVSLIHSRIQQLKQELENLGSTLLVMHLPPLEAFKLLSTQGQLKAVYASNDYEPYALSRDKSVGDYLAGQGIGFHTYKDHVIFEKSEIMKQDGKPFSVFTPYARRWLAAYEATPAKTNKGDLDNFLMTEPVMMPGLREIGFHSKESAFPGTKIPMEVIALYDKTRDIPEYLTSRLGLHLRFGTISIRNLAAIAYEQNKVFLNELIWREFFMSILYHFPHVVNQSFRPEYDRIQWVNNPADFGRWQQGMTGFPLVDAGMRELAETGFMHNRVRMVTASFLVKDLLIDWRWGEAWFAEKLLDFELSSNNGNWQWAAGCGCDAAPYFRIFNPDTQLKKFDPDLRYVRRWVPEYGTAAYPKPIVNHAFARERCLKAYKTALSPG